VAFCIRYRGFDVCWRFRPPSAIATAGLTCDYIFYLQWSQWSAGALGFGSFCHRYRTFGFAGAGWFLLAIATAG
jgi:hypothetical protein